MKKRHLLSRRQLAAVGHPLRQRMLDLLVMHGELSGREIARRMPNGPSNPYYHLDVLRRAGLIRIVRTERRRGAVEKYHAPVARTFSLDPAELLGTTGRRGRRLRSEILSIARKGADAALEDLDVALESGATGGQAEAPFITLCTLRLPAGAAEAIRDRLKAWLDEVTAMAHEGEGGECAEYVFYQLFFPRGSA